MNFFTEHFFSFFGRFYISDQKSLKTLEFNAKKLVIKKFLILYFFNCYKLIMSLI